MGRYVTGKKLKPYRDYLAAQATPYLTQPESPWQELLTLQKRMGPATHVGLNRALLDFSNGLVPYLTEQRYCGKVIYSGGDDVMAALPLEDLPEFLLSLRAAWQGAPDPGGDFRAEGGYWIPQHPLPGLAERPYFTMGSGATMSMGIAIAHKSVPLPTVLEHIWQAEKERAKKISGKDGLCFRVIYQSGNTLEALLKGSLLESWWQIVQQPSADLSPLLYRLAEDLPQRACVTPSHQLFAKAAAVIMAGRDERKHLSNFSHLETWLNQWEDWVNSLPHQDQPLLGTQPEDMGNLLRFSAFWVDKMTQRQAWLNRTAEGVR
jgi:CRISPR-associated protein Cmr2